MIITIPTLSNKEILMLSTEEILGNLTASLIAVIAAAISWLFMIFVGAGLIGAGLFKLGLLSNEGGAWVGISLGVPLGLLCAIAVFVLCFRGLKRLFEH